MISLLRNRSFFMVSFPVDHYTRLILGFAVVIGYCSFPIGLHAQTTEPLSSPAQEPVGQQVSISMESYAFTPSEVMVEVGKPVILTLRNESFLVPHNFLLDDPNGIRLIDADILSGDTQVVTLTFTEPGIYPFYCDKQLLFFPTHREQGMEGRLFVR
ncbi:MAG TPA: hypothetical protein DD706_05195 [Nitrospiraceae bacterium]|nr:hypothetical protein [Nitrospiraceae bacterium]